MQSEWNFHSQYLHFPPESSQTLWTTNRTDVNIWNRPSATLSQNGNSNKEAAQSVPEDDLNFQHRALSIIRDLEQTPSSPSPISRPSSCTSKDSSPIASPQLRSASFDSLSKPPKNSKDEVSVFIGRVPFDVTALDLSAALKERDITPKHCSICLNKRKKSKGFGFVIFWKPEEAIDAVEKLNGKLLFKDQKLPLRVEVCNKS